MRDVAVQVVPYFDDLTRLPLPPIIELLLCAADLAERGASFGLTEAVEWLGLAYSELALVASYEARAVAIELHTDGDIGTREYLEAAYRVAEGRGVSS